jgi:hypothetical protein
MKVEDKEKAIKFLKEIRKLGESIFGIFKR